MSEWKEYKINDIALNMADAPFGSNLKTEDYTDNGIIVIQGKNIQGRKCVWNDKRFVSKEKYQSLKRHHAQLGSLVFPKVGTIGKVGILTSYQNQKEYLLSTNTMMLQPNTEISSPDFIYYYFSSSAVSNHIQAINSNSVQPVFNFTSLKNYPISLPDLSEQNAIASVLTSLDDKIDLLHRQNATLEAMAETLFRQWFVEEAKEDWKEITLYDAIDLIGGGTPKTSIPEYWDGNIKWLSGGDIANNHKSIIISSEKSITELGLKNSSAKLLPKFSTIISARGTVGKYCILSEPMTFSQSNYGIKPKFENCYFFTYLLIAHSVDELISAAYGSVFDTITTDTFKGHSVTLPKLDNIKNFEIEVTPIFQKMLNNRNQIRTLTALRDTLLPKLMSGEVRVEM